VTPETRVLRPGGHDAPLSFRAYLLALRDDPAFADRYTAQLLDQAPRAFFWEHPPLSASTLTAPAELALVPAPALAGQRQDPAPFADHFARNPDGGVAHFSNLGGDAELIAPCPAAAACDHAHLAVFLRSAPKDAVRELWRATARAVLDRVGDAPLWLSTSGLGVAWLHLRLDTRPKYIVHAPYRRPPSDR